MFNMVARGISSPLGEADEDDIRDFVNRMHHDEFVKQRGGDPYSGSTKSDAKKFLKQFYKWKDGERGQYPDKVAWLSTKIPNDEKPEEKRVISQEECHKLAQSFSDNELYRATIYILFDSGFRISEYQSVKKHHLTKEEYERDDDCWWIECRESKTRTRKIPIPLFTNEINNFVESGYYKALDDGDKLFQKSYRSFLKALKRHSENVFNERITPHNLRHSSATLYADLLDGDLYSLCDRYGWDYASDTPKTYIRKSGTRQKKTATKVVNNKLSETNKRVDELEEENKELKDRLDKLEELMDRVAG